MAAYKDEERGTWYVSFYYEDWTGAREGEALSITPADIDFERNLLHINKTYYRMHGEDVITSPKTEESNRTISIPEFLKKEIRDYISRLYELPEDERIFPMVHEAVQHKLKQVVQKTGVKKIRVHDIRYPNVWISYDITMPPRTLIAGQVIRLNLTRSYIIFPSLWDTEVLNLLCIIIQSPPVSLISC